MFLDFSDRKIILRRLFKDKFALMNRQRFLVSGDAIPNGRRTILNEVLLNRSTTSVPEFEFSMNDDDKFFFPSAIVSCYLNGFLITILFRLMV